MFNNYYSDDVQLYLKNQCRILESLAKQVTKMLRSVGVKVHDPEAGFYIFCDFQNFKPQFRKLKIYNSLDMTRTILDKIGVSLLAGQEFGRVENEFSARLAFVDF